MSMSMGNDGDGEDEVNSTINTTPLVDIMLVLLIIFLITSPVVLNSIKVKLPADTNTIYVTKPENITLTINKEGDMYWNGGRKALAGTDELFEKMKAVAVLIPQPEVHIRGDQNTRYEFVGKTILTVQRAGIAKVGFIIEPPSKT
ncbi:MAG: biopolymer transporter ExbD [Pseudomonadota bacterium]